MADDTGLPHEIPFLEAADPPSIHGITSDMAAQVAERLGFVGKSIIATEESRTNTAYGTLTTPDQVASVVLPTDGVIQIRYRALWKSSVASAASATIFLGANEIQTLTFTGGPSGIAIGGPGSANEYVPLTTAANGLLSYGSDPAAAAGAPVTTGTALAFYNAAQIGGVLEVDAAAGTYTVSVQFKATSGSVTVKERKLWVRVLPF